MGEPVPIRHFALKEKKDLKPKTLFSLKKCLKGAPHPNNLFSKG